MENSRLKPSFDPSNFHLFTTTNVKEANKESPEFNRKLSKQQTERFDEIIKELEVDFKESGLNLTFSSRIIIHQVAMNIILLEKILFQSCAMPFIDIIHKDIVLIKQDILNSEHTPLNKEYNLHPFFEKMIFRLQKEINDGLKKLGLLPMQQIEKQKLTIIKKLKQRCEQIEKEYSIKAEKEVLAPKKKENSGTLRKDVCVEAE